MPCAQEELNASRNPAGLLIGSLIGGRLGDRLGRKKAMFLAAFITIPSVIIGGFIANFYAYLITRLITCTALPIMWIAAHTYGLEYFGPRHRKLVVCVKGELVGHEITKSFMS